MHNSRRRFSGGPGGEFWLLIAVLALLAMLALLHLAVQRERALGLAVIDAQTSSAWFTRPTPAPSASVPRSPS
jgi:hypothetical protein